MSGPISGPLVVGFDLDMTLIDTVPGFAATLERLGEELRIDFPVDSLTANLGPPLDLMLGAYLPPEAVGPAIDRFRALYPDYAIAPVGPMPGAVAALAAVRRLGGRIVVVTGKYTPNAALHLHHLGLDHDLVVGQVWGAGKAGVLREQAAAMYLGDHVHDVEGALAVPTLSVSVLTGGSTREELEAAGTHVILDDLLAFPDWLDSHVLRAADH